MKERDYVAVGETKSVRASENENESESESESASRGSEGVKTNEML